MTPSSTLTESNASVLPPATNAANSRLSHTAKRWRVYPHDPGKIRALEQAAGIPPVVAQLLVARGVHDSREATAFLSGKLANLRKPQELPGVNEAVDRLADAITAKRRIVIYGDYDVDGVTATSLLWQCVKQLGGDVAYHLPHRVDEGYGLHDESLRKLAADGAKTIVTVDCGVCGVAEAQTARELGLELIITDHHTFGERLPEAAAIVHPRLPGANYPFGELSGAAVAFKLAWALCQRVAGAEKVGPRLQDTLLNALGLAALGTVADVVPLVDENRLLVRGGLARLKDRPTLGLAHLMRLAELDKKERLSSDDVAFGIAPRLNAAGRLGQAQLAVELLTTESAERASALAEYINELNNSRRSLERSILLAAGKQAQDKFDPVGDSVLVLAERGWHPGVIGIVAGRLAEKYHRPVILIALDELGVRPGVGSARSVAGFDLNAALAHCGEHLLAHGGHAAAAGLKIQPDKIDAFRADLQEYAASEISQEERVAQLWIDAETPLASLTWKTVQQLEQLAPFGQGNPRPLLCASGVTLAAAPKKMGEGGRHLSLMLKQSNAKMRAVAFGNGDWAEQLLQDGPSMAIAFRPVINEYQGRRNVEMHLVDWRYEEAS